MDCNTARYGYQVYCDADTYCDTDGLCKKRPTPPAPECQNNEDCGGKLCVTGKCYACGTIYVDGIKVPCPTGTYCDGSDGVCKAPTAQPLPPTPTDQPIGARCGTDNECASGYCKGKTAYSDGWCALDDRCTSASDCDTKDSSFQGTTCLQGHCTACTRGHYANNGSTTVWVPDNCPTEKYCTNAQRCQRKGNLGDSCSEHIGCLSNYCVALKCTDPGGAPPTPTPPTPTPPTPVPDRCLSDANCSNGKICLDGWCRGGCVREIPTGYDPRWKLLLCPAGTYCSLNATCETKKNYGAACYESLECKANKCTPDRVSITVGKCDCAQDSDCLSGQYCAAGRCFYGSATSSSSSSTGGGGGGIITPPTPSPNPSPTPAPGTCQADSDCTAGWHCISGYCMGCVNATTGTSVDPRRLCQADQYCTREQICIAKKVGNDSCSESLECSSGICSRRWYSTTGTCACLFNLDCTAGQICQSGTCITAQCTSDADCGGKFCRSNQCVGCGGSVACPTGSYCSNDGTCQTQKTGGTSCRVSSECLSGNCRGMYAGDPASQCTCALDTQCAAGQACIGSSCMASFCQSNADCNGKICLNRMCTDCVAIPVPTPYNWQPTGRECATGQFCGRDGACQTKKTTGNSCAAPDECVSAVCRQGTCGCNMASQCPVGQFCTTIGTCASPQCTTDADCGGRKCISAECQSCRTGGDSRYLCAAGTRCLSDGTCVALKSAGALCNLHEECLSGGCVSMSMAPLPPGVTPGNWTGTCSCSTRFPCSGGLTCMPGGYCGQSVASSSQSSAYMKDPTPPTIPPLPGSPDPHERIPQTQCGNGMTESGEQCDDANDKDFDGCNRTCMRETGWRCNFECRQTTAQTGFFRSLIGSLFPFFAQTTTCRTYCTEVCGDTLRVGGEQCDLGTGINGNGSSTCGKDCRRCPVAVYCPDKQTAEGQMNAQGCFVPTGQCVPEGMVTPMPVNPTPPLSTCGNGIRESDEQCDNGGNNGINNLCGADCTRCVSIAPCPAGTHSAGGSRDIRGCPTGGQCIADAAVCGNGTQEAVEQCDNGAQNGKDGYCATDCRRCVQVNTPICATGTHLVGNTNLDARGCRQAATCQADGTPPASTVTCLTEGTITSVSPTTKPCCTGLILTGYARRNELGLCVQSQGTAVCTKCGDGMCNGLGENVCSCPRDCGGGTTTPATRTTPITSASSSSRSSMPPTATSVSSAVASSRAITTSSRPTATTTTKSTLATAVSLPTSVAFGDTVTVTVIVMNKGPADVTDIAARAMGNSALTFLPAASSVCVTKGIDIFCDEGGIGKSVPAGGKATFTFAYRTGDRSSCGRPLLLFLRSYSLTNKAIPNDITAKVTVRCPGT
ncbi:MAG: DUF4215 domain-containing protein [Candidatus Peribacter sp.]|nr:DUF4215 domain-containing protein [Candidatus Peribacter sp.]